MSVLTGCITVWFGNLTAQDCRLLQRQQQKSLARNNHNLITFTFTSARKRKTQNIIRDTSCPAHVLFSLLLSKKTLAEHQFTHHPLQQQLLSIGSQVAEQLTHPYAPHFVVIMLSCAVYFCIKCMHMHCVHSLCTSVVFLLLCLRWWVLGVKAEKPEHKHLIVFLIHMIIKLNLNLTRMKSF